MAAADSKSAERRPPLFTAGVAARLDCLAAHLPPSCQQILEIRLGEGSRVDLSVQVATVEEARRLLAVPLPDGVHRLLRRWSDRAGPFAAATRLWLEFDLPSEAAPVPAPVVCARLAPTAPAAWLSATLLPALLDRPLEPAERRQVEDAVAALPPGADVLYAFALGARPGPALRLEVCGFTDVAGALAYWQRLVGTRADELAELEPLCSGLERLHLSFDLGPEIGPRVGLEGSFPRQPAREPRWAAWFQRLIDHGLADAAKVAAVLAWPARVPGLVRGISHGKIAVEHGLAPEAKAYVTRVPWPPGHSARGGNPGQVRLELREHLERDPPIGAQPGGMKRRNGPPR